MSVRPRGPWPDWKPRTPRQVGILADLLGRYEQHEREDTLPRGGRGIFYDLRPNGMGNGIAYRKPDAEHPIKTKDGLPGFGPMEAHPGAVQEVLVMARRAGLIPEHWVADTRAPGAIVPLSYESTDEFVRTKVQYLTSGFALDAQRDQPVYIEVLCEAADLQERLARIAGEYGVPVYSGAGFGGLKGKRAFAERAMDRDVPTLVLVIGDRDDKGDEIYVAAAEDSVAWASKLGVVYPTDMPLRQLPVERIHGLQCPALAFFRLALTTRQAKALDLLDADGKAEVDGVPVPVMDRWLTEAIESLQDPARRESLRAEEERERERLPEAMRQALDDADS